MIVKDIQDPNVTAFDVHSIRFSAHSNITVSYEINYSDDKYKSQSTSIIEEPHADFMKSLIDMEFMAKSMIELPMANKDGEECMLNITTINFLKSTKYGIGVKFKLAVEGLTNSKDPVIIYSPSFYENGPHHKKNILNEELYPLQELDWPQLLKLQRMAKEAIKLVYYNKRRQPTLEEATDAAENGGYADELVDKKEAEPDGQVKKP